jgi:hypothetical protein
MFVTALTVVGIAFAIATGIESRRRDSLIVRRPWQRAR